MMYGLYGGCMMYGMYGDVWAVWAVWPYIGVGPCVNAVWAPIQRKSCMRCCMGARTDPQRIHPHARVHGDNPTSNSHRSRPVGSSRPTACQNRTRARPRKPLLLAAPPSFQGPLRCQGPASSGLGHVVGTPQRGAGAVVVGEDRKFPNGGKLWSVEPSTAHAPARTTAP